MVERCAAAIGHVVSDRAARTRQPDRNPVRLAGDAGPSGHRSNAHCPARVSRAGLRRRPDVERARRRGPGWRAHDDNRVRAGEGEVRQDRSDRRRRRRATMVDGTVARARGAGRSGSGRAGGEEVRAAILLAALALPATAHAAAELKAGVARVEITPSTFMTMYGYANRKCGPANGTHDPLFAKVLVLESGDSRMALVTADLGSLVSANLRRDVASKLGIPVVLLAASHTHSAPAFLPFGSAPV